jgi:hypothetical protein
MRNKSGAMFMLCGKRFSVTWFNMYFSYNLTRHSTLNDMNEHFPCHHLKTHYAYAEHLIIKEKESC